MSSSSSSSFMTTSDYPQNVSFSDLHGGNPLLEFDNQFSAYYNKAQSTATTSASSKMADPHSAHSVDSAVSDFEKYVTGEAVFNPAKYLSSSGERIGGFANGVDDDGRVNLTHGQHGSADITASVNMPLDLLQVTEDNFDACVQHLNTRLVASGVINRPLNMRSSSMGDRIQLVRCMLLLLQQRHGDLDARDKLHDRLSRLQCDNESLSANLKKARSQLANKTHEYEVLRARYASAQKDARRAQKRLQNENDRLQLRVRDFQQKVVQYEHSMQRVERESNRIKDRMQRLVCDKGTARARIDIVNDVPIPPASNWKRGPERNENTLYQNIVGAYEDEKQDLVRENTIMRETLRRLNNEVNHLRNLVHTQRGEEEFESRIPEPHPGVFHLPFDMVQSEIEGSTMAKLGELLGSTVTDEEKQLLEEERRNLAKQRSELEKFASELDNERLKLGWERQKLERQKQMEEFDREIAISKVDSETSSSDDGIAANMGSDDDDDEYGDDDDDAGEDDDDDYGILSPSNLRQLTSASSAVSATAGTPGIVAGGGHVAQDEFNRMLMGDELGIDGDDSDDDYEDGDTKMLGDESLDFGKP